jgi:hypothetical protein
MSDNDSKSIPTDFEQDGVLDIDILKQFTIPKRKTAKTELLESVGENSHEYQRDILQTIRHSYKDIGVEFKYTRPRLVHNSRLLDDFLQRKKQMRADGYADKDLLETFAFQTFTFESEARRVCETGIKTGNKPNLNCLGNPTMGIYLCKHANVLSTDPLHPRQSGVLVIFKVIKGRVKFLREKGSDNLEPTPNFDCHQMKTSNTELTSVTTSLRNIYESSQLYVYEYTEDSDLSKRPRQVLPYAVVDYRYVRHGGVVEETRPRTQLPSRAPARKGDALLPLNSNQSRASLPPSPAVHRHHAAKIPRLLPPPPPPPPDLLCPFPDPTIDSPPTYPLLNGFIPLKSTGIRCNSQLRPEAVAENRYCGSVDDNSSSSQDSFYASIVYDKRMMLSSACGGVANLVGNAESCGGSVSDGNVTINGSEDGSKCLPNDSECMASKQVADVRDLGLDKPSTEAAVERKCEAPCEHQVIWSGNIAVNNATICIAELSACRNISHQFGPTLNLSSKLSLSSIRSRYLQRLGGQFSRTREWSAGGLFFIYAALRPTGPDCVQLDRFIAYLIKSKAGGFIEYPDQHILLLLPDGCDIVTEYGLRSADEPQVALHCILVSSKSCVSTATLDGVTVAPMVSSMSSSSTVPPLPVATTAPTKAAITTVSQNLSFSSNGANGIEVVLPQHPIASPCLVGSSVTATAVVPSAVARDPRPH